MSKFPSTPWYQGPRAPSRLELDVLDLEVVGDIPPEIDGAFYRAAADHQFPPRFDGDSPFNADGMVHMYRIRNGQCDLKTRYVRTDKFKLEREHGRALLGMYRNRHLDDPVVAPGMSRALANTNTLLHAGVLLCLWEGANPVAVDPVTLETIGNWDFHGTMPGTRCSAHAKLDPVTGNLVTFGFAAKGEFTTDCVYYEVSPEGQVIHELWFQMPYFSEQHDCGITRDYICFPVVPIVGCGDEALRKGTPYYGWDPQKEIYLVVVPRFGQAEGIRMFKAPNQCTSHVMNAWNEGSKIFFDTCVGPTTCFPWWPEFGKPWDPSGLHTKLTRWTVDMASPSDAFEQVEVLSDFLGEFPRLDDRYQSLKYRHGWMLSFTGPRNQLAHVDLATGTTSIHAEPETRSVSEPCFIPRSADAPEGDGWIIQGITDNVTTLTEVNIYEALDVAKGPVARIKVPAHLKGAFHGNWVDGALVRPYAAAKR